MCVCVAKGNDDLINATSMQVHATCGKTVDQEREWVNLNHLQRSLGSEL